MEPLTITVISVSVVSVAVCAYKTVERLVAAPRDLVRQTGQSTEDVISTFASELRKFLGAEPRISVSRRIVQTGGTAIRELALYKEVVLITEEWQNTKFKSTKTLRVQQPFTLKAGFDLNRLKFEIDPSNKTVTATLSEATIVNLEHAGDFEVLQEEHGLWNRISPAERDAIINSLPEKAREEAEKLALRDKAVEQLKLFLGRLLPEGYTLAVRCTDDALDFQHNRPLANIPEGALSALGLVEEPIKKPMD